MNFRKIMGLPTAVMALWAMPLTAVAQAHTVNNTPAPSAMRVAIREMNPSGEADPRGRVMWVQSVPFTQYCEDVLPNEWVPSWNRESLKAGAMAVKMFAWYHHLHPITIDGYTFDVDNTVNFQAFRYYSRQPETNRAVLAVASYAYTKPAGEILELPYRAGYRGTPNFQYRNAQKMSQWGSEYWAQLGRNYIQILQFYYMDRELKRIR